MKNPREIEAMAQTARVEEMKAQDQALLSGRDTTAAREFAAGVEAGLLYALGNIPAPPFHTVAHVGPSGNDGLDLDDLFDLPGFHEGTD